MITYVSGNLFSSPAQVLVNAVNTVGVMGKGIAKDFKDIYPEMFKAYQQLCERGEFSIGQLWPYKTPNKWILNFPTKTHWRQPSKVEYIEAGLKKFTEIYSRMGVHSIAFPELGCGNGELDFESQVQPLMEKYLANLPIDVFIYSFHGDKFIEHKAPSEFKVWLRSQPESLAFTEVWDDIVTLVSKKERFETLTGRSDFSAELIEIPEEGIRFESSAGRSRFMSKLVFLQFWQQIRSYGYLKRDDRYGSDMMFPLGLLAELPYIQPVKVGDTYKNLVDGLQYDPSQIIIDANPAQLTLF